MNPLRPSQLPSGLYALADDGVLPDTPVLQKARWALEGGASIVQVRLKRATSREAVAICREVVDLCRSRGVACIVNDRVDWALLSGADGVHLGQEDLPVQDARRLLGPERLLGATVRSLEDALEAAKLGADHVGLGPLFTTRTKSVDHPPLGLHGLQRVAEGSPIPVVAIAGIGLENISDVARVGAHAAAVASAFLQAADPVQRVRGLVASFESGRAQRRIAGTP
ncbi:MAG: thiamine phosphate synthase [Myxococcaceae bacterium]